MDAKEFVYGLKRMCEYYGSRCYKGEDECPLINRACITSRSLNDDTISFVKDWVKKHPEKTRQSVFLEQYPNAKVGMDGTLTACPQAIDTTVECLSDVNCGDCCREYWGEVVE